MAYILTIPFFSVKLHFKTGGFVIRPLLDAQKVSMNETALKLSRTYRDLFQKKVLNEGNYLPIMDDFSEGDYYKASLKIPFDASRDGVSYPAFELELDYYFKMINKGVWGMVPVLGLETFAEEGKNIEERLGETIRLEFLRKRKFPLINEIISTIWFDSVELIQHDINLSFHSLKELDLISDEEEEKLVTKVATQLVPGGRVVYGRKKELELLVRALKSKFNKNVILVGPSGVGKTALVWEVVRLLKKHRITNKIWETTASIMVKELTKDNGWQHHLSVLCEELFKNRDILFIRNLLELFEVGKYVGNEISMADYMRTFIARGEVTMITECTEEELARIQLKNPNYTNLFQIIRLEEPKEELEEIIINKVNDIAIARKVTLEPDAIQETIRLNRRYTPYAGFPGKPIRFLESLFINRLKVSNIVTKSEVVKSFCEETGMPQFMVDIDILMDLKEIEQRFNANVFGQEQAVKSLIGLLASVKTALMRTGKPIASLLFIGPTGVGKTEMAKVLSAFMFGDKERMIRFDMSEFSDPYSVMRLTGESYFSDGLLTSAVRREPFCVLLFDEIEKAHPDFYDLLLQILSEGRLTDSSGKLVNFCSTIIIMTSNIGATNLQTNRIRLKNESEEEDVSDHFQSAVQKYFRPELYNRIDQVLPFKPLTKEVVRFVVDRELNLFRKREGIQFRKMDITIEKKIHDFLSEEGYNSKYGARYLQRTVREKLIMPLAAALSSFDYDDQLIVNIVEDKGKLVPKIDADPHGLELLLEELDKINLTDYVSYLRKQIYRLQEGHFYVMMLSELDIMKRQKEKLRDRFWKNVARGAKYTFYIETTEKVRQLNKKVEVFEEELSLSCLDLNVYNPDVVEELKRWEVELYQLKISLFAHLNPLSNQCVIAIYGSNLDQILKFYLEIINHQKSTYTARSVWFRETVYNMEVLDLEFGGKRKAADYIYKKITGDSEKDFIAPKPGDILYGVELKVEGDCCALFFEKEEGLQRWHLKDDQGDLYNVVIGGRNFKTPNNIHRKDFYKSSPRRIIQKDTIKDTKFKMSKSNSKNEFKENLLEELIRIFKIRLDEELLSL
jgi:ATP-dependent Clp protease ATP-binding subunit ClpA